MICHNKQRKKTRNEKRVKKQNASLLNKTTLKLVEQVFTLRLCFIKSPQHAFALINRHY